MSQCLPVWARLRRSCHPAGAAGLTPLHTAFLAPAAEAGDGAGVLVPAGTVAPDTRSRSAVTYVHLAAESALLRCVAGMVRKAAARSAVPSCAVARTSGVLRWWGGRSKTDRQRSAQNTLRHWRFLR